MHCFCNFLIRNTKHYAKICISSYLYKFVCIFPNSQFTFSDTLNVICESGSPVTVILNCTDEFIDLTYANWGRTQPYNTICPHHRPRRGENTNCRHSIVDQFSSCHGASSCIVRNVSRGGADPCWGTYKYIQVLYSCVSGKNIISLRSVCFLYCTQDGLNHRQFEDDIFKFIILNENCRIFIQIIQKFVLNGWTDDNKQALVQIMAWYRAGDKPLSELIMDHIIAFMRH